MCEANAGHNRERQTTVSTDIFFGVSCPASLSTVRAAMNNESADEKTTPCQDCWSDPTEKQSRRLQKAANKPKQTSNLRTQLQLKC